MSVLLCKNIDVTYILKKKQYCVALKDFNITINSGIVNILFGENGVGKTTLFNCICGLIGYDGEILYNNRNINEKPTKDRSIAFVQQNLVLFPKLTIFDNLAFPLKVKKLKSEEITKRIYDILSDFKITHLMNCLPNQISIGQVQKVLLAKILITNPKIIILDEAFSNVDELSKSFIQKKIKEYTKKHDTITIAVEHDIKEALDYGEYFYVMNNNEVIYQSNRDKVDLNQLNNILLK